MWVMVLKTFGNLSLEGSSFSQHKPLLLLTYLAIEGATERKDLANLFFPDAKDSLDSLSTTLRTLKNVINP